MLMFPENSYVENRMLEQFKFICWKPFASVMVFGGRVFGKWLGHEGWTLTIGISALIRDLSELPSPSAMRTRWEDGCLWTRKQTFTFILGFPAFRTVRNLLCVLGRLVYATIVAAQTDKHKWDVWTQRQKHTEVRWCKETWKKMAIHRPRMSEPPQGKTDSWIDSPS